MGNHVILGAGPAGLGAAYRLNRAGVNSLMFDRHSYHGGHCGSFQHEGGWIFDDGPHVSFTKVDRVRELFAESAGEVERIPTRVSNYWKGHWIKHPVQCNLHGLPRDLIVEILKDFVEAMHKEPGEIRNYSDWLVSSFGRTFAETFPKQYGRKYHTAPAEHMTTDWLGPRLYRPSLEEVLRGALSPDTEDVHYINEFRYPTHGGFVSFLNMFAGLTDLRLEHEAVSVDVRRREVRFANGTSVQYETLISSVPLPELIGLIPDAPGDVREAASKLAWTQAVIVNLGVDREDISPAHWCYFYDDDYVFTRLSFPHMLSRNTVPPGASSIQAEIYFSDKYSPREQPVKSFIRRTVEDLKRCGLLRETDTILFSEARLAPWAQVIFDLDRPAALDVVHGYLRENAVSYCGRYGDWGYLWSDESFLSGERAAEEALTRIGCRG